MCQREQGRKTEGGFKWTYSEKVMTMTEQEKTISAIEKTMREWIQQQLPIYEKLPAAQTMTTTQGEKVLKNNPATQEIRAAFKDYCYVVKAMEEMTGEQPVESKKVLKLVGNSKWKKKA